MLTAASVCIVCSFPDIDIFTFAAGYFVADTIFTAASVASHAYRAVVAVWGDAVFGVKGVRPLKHTLDGFACSFCHLDF